MGSITYFIGLTLAALLIASMVGTVYYWPKCSARADDD